MCKTVEIPPPNQICIKKHNFVREKFFADAEFSLIGRKNYYSIRLLDKQ